MRRVLVIRFSSLGDIILTLPSSDYLIATGCEVHYLTKSSFRPLLEIYGQAAHVHTIPDHATLRELMRMARELRSLEFETVYDLHRNIRSRIVGAIIGTHVRRIQKYRLKELLLYVLRRQIFSFLFRSGIDRAAESMRVVGGQRIEGQRRFRCLPPQRAEILKLRASSKNQEYVCLAAESTWHQKEWPLERFIEVAHSMAELGYGVVWLGLEKLSAAASFAGVLDLTAQLSLPEVAAVLTDARLLISNDSGLMHMAEASGTPVVAIFGPTSKELGFAPRLKQSYMVEARMWCRPCSKTGRWCIRPVNRRKCLSDVTVSAVKASAEDALRQTKLKMVKSEDLDL